MNITRQEALDKLLVYERNRRGILDRIAEHSGHPHSWYERLNALDKEIAFLMSEHNISHTDYLRHKVSSLDSRS